MVSLFPLNLRGATVRRKSRRLLGPVDLTLDAHSMTILMGPNGSGKTTLLRLMHGVERLSDGSAQWALDDTTAQRKQAYVFQTPIMLRRTVGENLFYPLALRGVSKRDAAGQVRDWAERIGLGQAIDRHAPRLSGGEKQKLALARALIAKPEVLFLDEPCANLDGASTRDIETLLRAAIDSGTQIIMATHDIGQMRRLGVFGLFLQGGQLRETGPIKTLLTDPQSPALRAFIDGDIVE